MKNQIINEIQRKMLPYLNNEQLLHLKAVLEASFQGVIIEMGEEQPKAEEQDSAAAFITAKRIEGCSCLLYTSPSPRDGLLSRMPSSA